MRYLRRFEERLSPDTYTSAAKKLRHYGHHDRAEALDAKALDMARARYAKNGLYGISKFRGLFYITLEFDERSARLIFDEWMSKDRFEKSLWVPINVIAVPADAVSQEAVAKLGGEKKIGINLGSLRLRMSGPVGSDGSFLKGDWELDPDGFAPGGPFAASAISSSFKFADRKSALRVKRLLADVLSNEVVVGETTVMRDGELTECPGGVLEQMLEFYCEEKHVGHEVFSAMARQVGASSINTLYSE